MSNKRISPDMEYHFDISNLNEILPQCPIILLLTDRVCKIILGING